VSLDRIPAGAEGQRLREDARREKNWKRWGPYLADRQWGTVREDYSADGNCWAYFPHEHARSRAYRWGEDGLLGICDRECRLCFALALWNGRDEILKERPFGLSGPEGNHGEDVKEIYFHLASTPTHSYCSGMYRYPQAAYPYRRLVEENTRAGKTAPEFELIDTGVLDDGRFFDVTVEYAKASPNDLCIRITACNRAPEMATLHMLPTLWFRNTWSWGSEDESGAARPELARIGPRQIRAEHATLEPFLLAWEPAAGDGAAPDEPAVLFTDNETNTARLFGSDRGPAHAKDAFHERVVRGRRDATSTQERGTKAAVWHQLRIPAHGRATLRLRLCAEREAPREAFGPGFDGVLRDRQRECDEFYAAVLPPGATGERGRVARAAYAGLLWSKQFYHYVVKDWLAGDPAQPPPPPQRRTGRNSQWTHLYNRDVILMPDKWEYPWYAAWDLAFHAVAVARVDPALAKDQLILLLREWYMHPNGQIPAYEFALGDVNPPVHAWACWRVYKITAPRGRRDRAFLARCFHKLLLNFTWWVNRKDPDGRNLFTGGFLGLDNIGVFDRSAPLPEGVLLHQADGTAWMAFFCGTMLAMALELAAEDPTYEDVASKFFEHFVAIADAMNTLGGTGLWDEQDGFYYDQLLVRGEPHPLRVRSLVGLIPLLAVELLDERLVERLPGFRKRMRWFLDHRTDLARHISDPRDSGAGAMRLLAIPSRERLERSLAYMLDEAEFLSPFGVRSLSRVHAERPFVLHAQGREMRVGYEPGDSTSSLFGGNSNWRGPIWFPINYLLVEALDRYDRFFGDGLTIECPARGGRRVRLRLAADELRRRLISIFLPAPDGRRPCHGADPRWASDPLWRDHLLFHECFHGDTGAGLGASHQTGWTALAATLIHELERPAQPRIVPA